MAQDGWSSKFRLLVKLAGIWMQQRGRFSLVEPPIRQQENYWHSYSCDRGVQIMLLVSAKWENKLPCSLFMALVAKPN